MMSARIYQKRKLVNRRNPISGHEWTEHELLNRWLVINSAGITTGEFRTEKAAERELQAVKDFEKKFPSPALFSSRL